jgi:hypothetical protein
MDISKYVDLNYQLSDIRPINLDDYDVVYCDYGIFDADISEQLFIKFSKVVKSKNRSMLIDRYDFVGVNKLKLIIQNQAFYSGSQTKGLEEINVAWSAHNQRCISSRVSIWDLEGDFLAISEDSVPETAIFFKPEVFDLEKELEDYVYRKNS